MDILMKPSAITVLYTLSTVTLVVPVLIFDLIDYRFAEVAVVISLLLYIVYSVLEKYLEAKEELLLYQASFFLLIGAFLSLGETLYYFPLFLFPYTVIMRKEIDFNSNELLKVGFSVLAFWILLIQFNDLGYFGLFLAISAGLLIYLLNDVIESKE